MARTTRIIIPHLPHHVVQRGNNRQNIFQDEHDRHYFLSKLKAISKEANVLVGSYCLMTNHVHLLLYPNTVEGLIKLMKNLFQLYTQRFNFKHKRTGKLWENRYKLHLVDPDYEWVVSRYIERNPVRAKMVTVANDYLYSSAEAHLKGVVNELLTKDIIGNQQTEYCIFFYEPLASAVEHIKLIKSVTRQQKVLGGSVFIRKLEQKFQKCFEVRKPGRPFVNHN